MSYRNQPFLAKKATHCHSCCRSKTEAIAPSRLWRHRIGSPWSIPAAMAFPSHRSSPHPFPLPEFIERDAASLPPCFKPALERCQTLPRWPTRQQTLYADVFVQVFPVNVLARSVQFPVVPFRCCRMEKPRIPDQRNGYSPPVSKLSRHCFTGHLDMSCCGCFRSNGQRSHAGPLRMESDTVRRSTAFIPSTGSAARRPWR